MKKLATSLGPELVRQGSVWVLDLGSLPIIHGLSVLSRALAEMIVAQARSDRIDISVERKLRPRENPELIEVLGVGLVKVCAEHESVAEIAHHPEAFEHHLRALLGNLQRARYRNALIPSDPKRPRALLADFSQARQERADQRFLMEFVPSAQARGRGFLRITIEDPHGRRLDLSSIPHVQIEDVEERTFISGSTRIAHTWTDAVRREAERGRRTLVESRRPHSHLFSQLAQAGLGAIERVALQWNEAAMPAILEGNPANLHRRLKRVLLALEDRAVRRLLAEREVVRIDGEGEPVYLDVSHLGRVLNLSLGERRERAGLESFLARMPALARVADAATERPLEGVRVFLIHHMTAEVLGLIAALRQLGCRDLVCLFVVYGGEAPSSYLDALLDVPVDEFRALALTNVPTQDSVEGHYRLSSQYSALDEAEEIAGALSRRGNRYLEAMRAAAVVSFLRQLERARGAGERLLLVEDGGYLAPLLNRALLAGEPTRAFLARLGLDGEDRPLEQLLGASWIGSVEHTRNGFDRLTEIEAKHGRLARPAFSIAISRLKVAVESREVAASVLSAVENVLNATGKILARRRCLVLGSRGAIGRELMRALAHRLDQPAEQLSGVDLRVVGAPAGGCREARDLAGLGAERWSEVDLVLGVTGCSVLQGADLEGWLAAGSGRQLFLASGSTKTVEYEDVAAWTDALLQEPEPRIAGRRVQIDVQEVTDPRTGRLYAQRFSITAVDDEGTPLGAPNRIVFLANLTPVNFLFYGVATELIDEVLAQLLSVSLGLVQRAETAAPRLHAVDRDIDAEGSPLGCRRPAEAPGSSGGRTNDLTGPSAQPTRASLRRQDQ